MRILDRRIFRIALCAASSIAFCAVADNYANAQVSFGPDAGDNENSICSRNGVIGISINDDCDKSDPLLISPGITVGPAGSQTSLNGTTGAATFGAAATFNSGLVSNNTSATFNAGLSSTSVTTSALTVNGASTFNGGVSVQSGQTVNFNGNRLQGVGTPTAGTDAANKNYVDAENDVQDDAIAAIQQVNSTQSGDIAAIQVVNSTQQTQINSLNTITAGLQDQIDAQSAQIGGLQSDVKQLRDRDSELAEGIAISLALDAPVLRSGQTFALRGGYGNFDGASAAGFTAAGAVSSNVVVDAGVGFGTSDGTVAGKAGVTVGW